MSDSDYVWFEDGYHALLDAILSDEQVERAAKALASHWHGPAHPCMKAPCDDCLTDARRCIEGAIPLGQEPIDKAYERAKAAKSGLNQSCNVRFEIDPSADPVNL